MIRSITTTLLVLALSVGAISAKGNRVALVQSSFAWGDYEANIAAFEDKIGQIEGCDIIILPELFTSGCDMQRRDKQVKESLKREIAARYCDVIDHMQIWAKDSGAVIIGSTIYEEDSLFYNRLLAVYPTGEYFHYDKHNCFKMGSFSPGTEHLVITVNDIRYATYICYDLRFAEWSQNDGRYDCAIYIANWPESRVEDWSRLLSERAKENSAYVFGVNCVGTEPGGVYFDGGSAVYAADGSLKVKCRDGVEDIIIVE